MKNRRALTGRQKQVLGCIIDYQREHGFSPSIRDLCEMTGLRSSCVVEEGLTFFGRHFNLMHCYPHLSIIL